MFFSTQAWSQKTIVVSKAMPLELNLILGNLHLYSPESVEKIRPVLYSIDYSARSFKPEDLLLLVKVEIYKTLLKSYDTPAKEPMDGKSIEAIKAALLKSNDNFMRWFLEALLKDSQDLISNPFYKEFLLQKDVNVKVEKIEYKKLEKKAELLQAWISKIHPDAEDFPDSLKSKLTIKMLEVITNIKNTLTFISRESSQKSKEQFPKMDSELKFFSYQDYIAPTVKKDSISPDSKSVEDILAPLTTETIEPAAEKLPSPVKDDWTPDPNLPKPSNDAGWLEDF